MKNTMVRLTSGAVVGLALSVLTVTAQAGQPPNAKNMVPIKGLVTTSITNAIPPTAAHPVLQVFWVGGGFLSHLGLIAAYSDNEAIDVRQRPGVMTGDVHFKAANGDELVVEMHGFDTTEAGGPVTFEGRMIFKRGTGRFAKTSGSAIFVGGADMQAFTGWFTVEGEIAYSRE